MTGKLGRGAFFALLTAAAIAGCSKSGGGSTILGGGNPGDLGNPDNVPNASTISQNNLADDTGAFSNNGQTFLGFKCAYNSSPASVSSSSASSNAADGTAMILFTTRDGASNADRLYATHFEGGSFTVPVEISGDQRDETLGGDIDLNSAILVPLNTGNYADPTTGQQVQAVTRNKGNWVILWSATTRFTDPKLITSSTAGAEQAVALEGPRRTIYYTLFVHSLRSTSKSLSDALGKPNSQTTAGTTKTYEYGFLTRAVDLIKTKNSGFVGGAVKLTKANGRNVWRAAEDVINFGVTTDTFTGVANFASGGSDIQTGAKGVDLSDMTSILVQNRVGKTTAVAAGFPGVGARPLGSSYQVGDPTTFLRLFFVQLTSSRTSAGDTYTSHPFNEGAGAASWGGARYRLFSSDFDLDAQDFKTAAEVTPPASRPAPTGPSAANCRTQPSAARLASYNGHFFWSYLDASLAGDNTNLAGAAGQGFGLDVDQLLGLGVPSMRTLSKIQACTTVTSSSSPNAGVSTIAKTVDLTILGTAGVHLATAAALPGGPVQTNMPASEMNTIGPLDEVTSIGFGNPSAPQFDGNFDGHVFGQDHGLVDTSVYFLAQCNSVSATSTLFSVKTAEVQLCCAAIDPKTGSLIAGSPKVLSKHDTTATVGGTGAGNSNLDGAASGVRMPVVDSVLDYTCGISRIGDYILTVFRQMKGGTVQGGEVVLNAIQQQTYRDPSQTVPSTDVRFTAAAVQVNAGAVTHPLQVPTLNTGEASTAGISAVAGHNGNTRTGAPRKLFDIGNNGVGPAFGVAMSNQVYQRGTISGDTRASDVEAGLGANGIGNGNTQGGATGTYQGLKGQFVHEYILQENLGVVCGVQSDNSKMNVLWTLCDGTEDSLYVAQIGTALGTATPTPTFSPATVTEREITAPATVGAPGIFNSYNLAGAVVAGNLTGLKSTFKFLPNSIDLRRDVHMIDLGVDATQPTGVGGGVMIFFWRIDDATLADGNFFDPEIYAATFDGTTVSAAVRCSRIHEDNKAAAFPRPTGFTAGSDFNADNCHQFVAASRGGNFLTSMQRLLVAPRSNSTSQNNGSFSADYAALIFTAPSGDSGTTVRGLFCRQWDETIRRTQQTGGTPTLDLQFTPAAGVGAVKPTDSTRLSRELTSGDVGGVVDVLRTGKHFAVLFQQDKHLYVTQTDDGKAWSADNNGKPNPPLFDNNTTADFFGTYRSCHKNDSSCDDFHGSISLFVKQDIASGAAGSGDLRAFVRTWN